MRGWIAAEREFLAWRLGAAFGADARKQAQAAARHCPSPDITDVHLFRVRRATVSFVINDRKHWRNRAEEARSHADEMNDPEATRQMLEVARGYNRLAERAQERSRGKRT
jgi:hypothetical protein